MAISRRAEQKEQTQVQKIAVQYSYHAPKTSKRPGEFHKETESKLAVQSLFPYDVKLIFNDLFRTFVITTLIFLILLITYWYLNR